MKSLMSNARDVCLEVEGSVKHHATFARYVQNMLHKLPESSSILLVLDGAQWPLKAATHTRRRNSREAALARVMEANAANDQTTADKFFREAVTVPSSFTSWILTHFQKNNRVDVVVAAFEADAQLACLEANGQIDIVLSAAEDSDFIVYGMRRVMYNLKQDGSFHEVAIFDDVLGKIVKVARRPSPVARRPSALDRP
ncbi:hypothetical protein AB1Y20_014961 [Prymnesium parvum]|uniref:XPG-I domain-containing protein n=1 Tax=Prymnesium parvum TaxID=97485 RepID=A0AB34K157_PRYPA